MSDIDIPYEIRVKYLERRKTDLQDCKSAFERKDLDTFIRVGHQVKGNATSYGFDDLGSIAIDLENSALQNDWQGLENGIKKFEEFLNQTNVEPS